MTTHEVGVVRPMMDSTWLAVGKRDDLNGFDGMSTGCAMRTPAIETLCPKRVQTFVRWDLHAGLPCVFPISSVSVEHAHHPSTHESRRSPGKC